MTSSAARWSEPPAATHRGLPIAEVAQRTGLSKDTLRYYEKAGLVEAVERSSGGQRRYATADLDWLAFLLRLRATGMPIADMQRFAELRKQGDASIAERLALLSRHLATVLLEDCHPLAKAVGNGHHLGPRRQRVLRGVGRAAAGRGDVAP
jgi:DNA-binding transcriptional MerR regulator